MSADKLLMTIFEGKHFIGEFHNLQYVLFEK